MESRSGGVAEIVRRWSRWGLDALFPESCVGCSREGAALCPVCVEGLAAKPTRRELRDGTMVVALYPYADPLIRRLVREYKFNSRTALQETFGRLISAAFGQAGTLLPVGSAVCVPIPLARRRQRQRGFNQAAALAEIILDFLPAGSSIQSSLRRVRSTKQQALLPRERRAKNVRDAFEVKGNLDAGRRYLLIDDIVTSGETLVAAARALRGAGAEQVSAWAFAQASPAQD